MALSVFEFIEEVVEALVVAHAVDMVVEVVKSLVVSHGFPMDMVPLLVGLSLEQLELDQQQL